LKPSEIIGKNYLRNFLFLFLFVLIAGAGISALILHLNVHQSLNTHYGAVLSIISEIQDTLIKRSLKISAVVSMLMIVGLLVLGILYTHRIAGPLYRIKEAAKAVQKGDLGRQISLRRKDVIHAFASSLNSLTGTYAKKVTDLRSGVNRLKDSVSEIQTLTDNAGDIEEKLHKLSEIDSEMKSLIDDLK